MSAWIEPLDLETIFVNLLAGTPTLFTFLSFMVIAGMAAYFRMPNEITLIMFALFGVIMSDYLGGMYSLLILLAGLLTFYSIKKITD